MGWLAPGSEAAVRVKRVLKKSSKFREHKNFIEVTFPHECIAVKLVQIFRAASYTFPDSYCEWIFSAAPCGKNSSGL